MFFFKCGKVKAKNFKRDLLFIAILVVRYSKK